MAITFAEMAARRKAKELELAEKYGENYAEPGRIIQLNYAEEQCVREWVKGLEPELAVARGDDFAIPELTYCFTATGLGYVIVVKEAITGKELNVTAALDWHFFG